MISPLNPTSTQSTATEDPTHTPSQTPPTRKKEREQSSKPHRIWRGWKEVWAVLGPIVALTGLFLLLIPQVRIEPSVNLDPSQPLSTQFLVSNVGRIIPVYNVRFGCAFGSPGGNTYIGRLETIPRTLAPVAVLRPGHPVTRACAEKSADIETGDVAISATYVWPVIGWQSTEMAHFSIRKGAPGFFLVPNIPSPLRPSGR